MELKDQRGAVKNVFIAILFVLLIFELLQRLNPFLFPGLREKLFWIVVILGVLTFVLYLPYEKLTGTK